MKMFIAGVAICCILLLTLRANAATLKEQAPEFVISEWINTSGLSLKELKGKVIIIDFFQLWCPGCNKFSGPLMKKWMQKYSDRNDIQFVGIHTVFEGHSQQTPEKLRQYVKEKNITYPVGVDKHIPNQRLPETMARYNTRGTPEMAIIDKNGNIRFQHFGSFKPATIEKLIDTLLDEN